MVGQQVTRTQWLDFSSVKGTDLIGKNILIVDEVDDTRTTLQYAVQELEKDVMEQARRVGRQGEKTNFFIFVLHVSFPFLVICINGEIGIIGLKTDVDVFPGM